MSEALLTEAPEALAPIAHMRGEPVNELPKDLYIPPEAMEVLLEETFQGPLDLLLYLIRRHNLDILDIPMATITAQYMAYIEVMQEFQLTLAAEYLLMAAMLTEIKSRMLLPKPTTEAGESGEDPRAELVRRLQVYERFKKAAQDLDDLPRVLRDTLPVHDLHVDGQRPKPLPEPDLALLAAAFQRVLARAEFNEKHAINMESLSIRARMSDVMTALQTHNRVPFESLFKPQEGRMGMVVTFVALLELGKESLIQIIQVGNFTEIHVQLAPQSPDNAQAADTEHLSQAPMPEEPPMSEQPSTPLKRILEAILLTANEPLSPKKLVGILGEAQPANTDQIRSALAELAEDYTDRAVDLVEVGSGFRFQAAADVTPWVLQAQSEKPPRLSPAFLETLALIAYRQPITRAEIEGVRGVAVSANILRSMMEREWVKVVGHREVPGRPELLATTQQFLNDFNLKKLSDLPTFQDMKEDPPAAEQLPLNVGDADQEDTTPATEHNPQEMDTDSPTDDLPEDLDTTDHASLLEDPSEHDAERMTVATA